MAPPLQSTCWFSLNKMFFLFLTHLEEAQILSKAGKLASVMRCDNEWVPEIKVVTPACQRMQHQIRHQGIVICAGSGTFSTQVVITTWMRGPTVAVQSDVLVWFTRTQFINSTINRPECTLSPRNPIGYLKLICLFFTLRLADSSMEQLPPAHKLTMVGVGGKRW